MVTIWPGKVITWKNFLLIMEHSLLFLSDICPDLSGTVLCCVCVEKQKPAVSDRHHVIQVLDNRGQQVLCRDTCCSICCSIIVGKKRSRMRQVVVHGLCFDSYYSYLFYSLFIQTVYRPDFISSHKLTYLKQKKLKGALCHYGEWIQTQNFNIYNIN